MTGNKISVYIKNNEVFRDIKLLAEYEGFTLTDLVNNLLYEFTTQHSEDLNFLRQQADEREARKSSKQTN